MAGRRDKAVVSAPAPAGRGQLQRGRPEHNGNVQYRTRSVPTVDTDTGSDDIDDDDLDGGDEEEGDERVGLNGFNAEPPPFSEEGEDGEGGDAELQSLNDTRVTTFGDPPLIGGKTTREMYGSIAESVGQASSPKLWTEASRFPTVTAFSVWKRENGVPCGIGSVDANCTDDEFIVKFWKAMPKDGDGKAVFILRPTDMAGNEIGKEFHKAISDTHATIHRIRKQEAAEKEERMSGHQEPIIVNQGEGGSAYAEEMGRLYESAIESADRQREMLQQSLEEERAQVRAAEKARYEEQAKLSERTSDVTLKLTEKLMDSDRIRADEQMKMQQQQASMALQTVTTVLTQQQQATNAAAERQRVMDQDAATRQRDMDQQAATRQQAADAARATQDREFFSRQQAETEARRVAEREEFERKQQAATAESERKHREQVAEWERRRQAEKEESEARLQSERSRLDLEQKRLEEQRKFELEQLRMDTTRIASEAERRQQMAVMELEHRRAAEKEEYQRREAELERRRVVEREENQARLDRERMELDRQKDLIREESGRREAEMERRRQAEKDDMILRMQREKLEFDHQQALAREERERWTKEIEARRQAEKEEADRKERAHAEKLERERQEFTLRIERERLETERSLGLRREEMQKEAERRRDEMALQQKAMEMTAQKDREHSERLMEMARMERDAAREAQTLREKQERDAREFADRERQRQQDLALKQIENDKQAAREHQERLFQLNKNQTAGTGLGAIDGMAEILDVDKAELYRRLFGGGGGEDDDKGGWIDAVPKVLGTLAELAAVAMKARGEQIHVEQRGRRQLPDGARIIQTPEGPRVILQGGATGIPGGQRTRTPPPLPDQPHVPPEFQNDMPDEDAAPPAETGASQAPKQDKPVEQTPTPVAEPANTMARAKTAGINLIQQKKARKGIRAMVEAISNAEPDTWIGIATEAITKNVGIYEYIRAVSVKAALSEAMVEETLQDKIVSMMRNSGMIPDDVPYDETDYAKLHGDGK